MGFFKRIKKGYKKAGELKEKFEKYQDERAEKATERAKIQTARWKGKTEAIKARADTVRAQNRLAEEKRRHSGFALGSFGGGKQRVVDFGEFTTPVAPQQTRKPKQKQQYAVVGGKAYPVSQQKKIPLRKSSGQPRKKKQKGIAGLDYLP